MSALQTSSSEVVPFMQAKEKDSAARIKKFMTMMDSMTNKELDSSDIKLWQTESRIMRIARGAGVHPNYVGELIGMPTRLVLPCHTTWGPLPALETCLVTVGWQSSGHGVGSAGFPL